MPQMPANASLQAGPTQQELEHLEYLSDMSSELIAGKSRYQIVRVSILISEDPDNDEVKPRTLNFRADQNEPGAVAAAAVEFLGRLRYPLNKRIETRKAQRVAALKAQLARLESGS